MEFTDLRTVLLGQWRAASRMSALVDAVAAVRADAKTVLDWLEGQSVSSAGGMWLDGLAARLGAVRPLTADQTLDARFGFDDAGSGFGQQPFRGAAANDLLFPLPDDRFRRLLRARMRTVRSSGSAAGFAAAVREIDAAAEVVDGRDMTVRVRSAEHQLLQTADGAGFLPRPAGVQVTWSPA